MKRIAVLTLYKGNKNYGGLLQAYAMQKIFSTKDSICEVISYEADRKKYLKNRLSKIGIRRMCRILKRKVLYKIYMLNRVYREGIEKRNYQFEQFEKSIPHSPVYGDSDMRECGKNYDVFVCGSDQIWNPTLWNENYFLNFASEKKKKIAYAASIGKGSFSESEKKYVKEHLQGFDAISMRESYGQKIIHSITGLPISLVLDPTLLITAEEWKEIMKKPIGCPKKYAFAYFFGYNQKMQERIYKYCQKERIPLVIIPHIQGGYKKTDIKYSDIQLYDVGPREWIYLIAHAELIFTESFHGTAFSINFNKEFYCIGKNGSENRMRSLLSLLHLEDRILKEEEIINRKSIDYTRANKELEVLRTKSEKFLRNALGVEEK